MSELGRNIIRAIEFIGEFYKDVSRLVGCVEDNFKRLGLVSAYHSASFVGSSYAWYGHDRWMPRVLYRFYVLAGEDEGKSWTAKDWDSYLSDQRLWTFFICYFAPKRFQEPVAIWGQVSLTEPGNPWDRIETLIIRNDGPGFLESATILSWQPVSPVPPTVESMVYRASPLLSLKDEDAVQKLVVGPVAERLPAK